MKSIKKLVNGKVVSIDNIELFELAAEGAALQSKATANVEDGFEGEVNSAKIKGLLKRYEIFYANMPYPLYAIESDVKYAALGSFIRSLSKEKSLMWIDNGLNILINAETGMTLKFVNKTWSIITTNVEAISGEAVDLSGYESEVGYKEFTWALGKMLKRENTGSFYKEFMPDFLQACNSNKMILKFELENMLTFGAIPSKMDFKINRVINLGTQEEYSLDIYPSGYIEDDDDVQEVLSISPMGISASRVKARKRVYKFDAYSKDISSNPKNNGKITKCTNIVGLHTLFMELVGLKGAIEMVDFPDFYGAIFDTNFVFSVDKRLYIAKSNRLVEPKEIARGVDIYAIENGKIYFTKTKKISDRVNKDILYSYSIRDESLRICKVIFSF